MKEEVKTKKKGIKIKTVIEICTSVCLILMFVVLSVSFISRLTGKNNGIFGFHINIIVTDSMEPEIKVGDIIVSRSYKGQDLEKGDVVTYVAKSGEKAGELITHKIVDISGSGDDMKVTTRGVNPNVTSNDAPIRADEIVSVMVYKTVLLKYVYKVLTHPAGFLFFVILPLVATIIGELVSVIKQYKKNVTEQ